MDKMNKNDKKVISVISRDTDSNGKSRLVSNIIKIDGDKISDNDSIYNVSLDTIISDTIKIINSKYGGDCKYSISMSYDLLPDIVLQNTDLYKSSLISKIERMKEEVNNIENIIDISDEQRSHLNHYNSFLDNMMSIIKSEN